MNPIADLPVPAPVYAVTQVQKLTETVSRAAAQTATLGAKLPTVQKETPRAINGGPVVMAYDKHGGSHKESEEPGQQLNFTA
jgi:hypothetical protein